MIELLSQHQVLATVVTMAVFSSLVQAMEKPNENDGRLYRYIYRLGHLLAFNFQHAARVKFPDYIPGKDAEDSEVAKLKGE